MPSPALCLRPPMMSQISRMQLQVAAARLCWSSTSTTWRPLRGPPPPPPPLTTPMRRPPPPGSQSPPPMRAQSTSKERRPRWPMWHTSGTPRVRRVSPRAASRHTAPSSPTPPRGAWPTAFLPRRRHRRSLVPPWARRGSSWRRPSLLTPFLATWPRPGSRAPPSASRPPAAPPPQTSGRPSPGPRPRTSAPRRPFSGPWRRRAGPQATCRTFGLWPWAAKRCRWPWPRPGAAVTASMGPPPGAALLERTQACMASVLL